MRVAVLPALLLCVALGFGQSGQRKAGTLGRAQLLPSSQTQATSAAEKPRMSRGAVEAMEKTMDDRLRGLWTADPLEVIGLTQGIYLSGYGGVFMGEVNLAPASGITPFHPTRSPDEVKRIHEKKVARLPELKKAIEQMLLDSAGSLDTVRDNEQIAVGISLFYWVWEDKAGLPAQIVMRAPKGALVQIKTGKTAKTALNGIVTVDEF